MIIDKTDFKLTELVTKILEDASTFQKSELDKDIIIIDSCDGIISLKCDDREFSIKIWRGQDIDDDKTYEIEWTLFCVIPYENKNLGTHLEKLSRGISIVDY